MKEKLLFLFYCCSLIFRALLLSGTVSNHSVFDPLTSSAESASKASSNAAYLSHFLIN